MSILVRTKCSQISFPAHGRALAPPRDGSTPRSLALSHRARGGAQRVELRGVDPVLQLLDVQLRRSPEAQDLVLDFLGVLDHLQILRILVLQHALGGAMRAPSEPTARTRGGGGGGGCARRRSLRRFRARRRESLAVSLRETSSTQSTRAPSLSLVSEFCSLKKIHGGVHSKAGGVHTLMRRHHPRPTHETWWCVQWR